MARSMSLQQSFLLGFAGLFAFFALWTFLSVSGLTSPLFLPSPAAVAERFGFLLHTRFAGGTLLQHLGASFERFAYGFGLAALVGIPLGLMMGWFRLLDDIVTPLFDAVRFIAPIAWVPFAALWFGTGIGGPIMIIFAGAFPPCLINAYRGAKFVDPRLIEAARMLGTPDSRTIMEVLFPSSVPSIIAGLRVSAGLGWQSLVGAELIVASTGVGYMMVQGQGNLSTTTVMSGMIAIGLVGIAIDILLRGIEARILRGRGQPG
ncbi:ABC transporter permease [Brucella sp. NBRC 12950]|uniref:ABC transporter permease n=1 Tax=Brucella sp. NBRC 12950 TaxID=2994518 RepID=UPI0024A33D86|nr:ABC transporter permease [Brucella sp. NBRC 12950]GLU28083.1 taurine ABC transporter permease [Brucella sp. NBRC 12950]